MLVKRSAIALLLVLVLLPVFPTAGAPASFQGGQDEVIANLADPRFEDTVHFDVLADRYFLNATTRVAAVLPEDGSTACPEGVQIDLNGTPLWQFNRTGFGPLGRQDRFSNEKPEAEIRFGSKGGTNTSWIRLPKDAAVQHAFLELNGSPPLTTQELFNYTGTAGDQLGFSVSGAGDVNHDGCGDVIVGAPCLGAVESGAGGAFLHLGSREPDNVSDMSYSGLDTAGHYGRCVSEAGDVNQDGYGDLVVLDSEGGNLAQVFFGGPEPDGVMDVSLIGDYPDEVGYSVAAAGDVNGDGFDDIIVGGETAYSKIGGAHIYYGGIKMNGTPDVSIGVGAYDNFGYSVSGAGDLNNDGYDDVIVGAPYENTGVHEGQAYIFFGGTDMGQNPDVYLIGASGGDLFGKSVSGAGDLNADGYDDVVVGAPCDDAGGTNAGRAFVYFGGPEIDNLPDATYTGADSGDWFGVSVSGAGDFNIDGIDDLMVGASLSDLGGSDAGRAYMFFGGRYSDSVADVNLTGAAAKDRFGCSVSGIGDQDGDGHSDVAVGACLNDAGGKDAGRVYVYSMNKPVIPGVQDVAVTAGSEIIWNISGFLNGAAVTKDFARALNDILGSTPVAGSDFFGNGYVDVPLTMSAKSPGKLTIGKLCIVYQYKATVPDFSTALNAYLRAHQDEKDARGYLTVPLKVFSRSAGRVGLLGLDLTPDLPPVLVRNIGDVGMDEDTIDAGLVDLHAYFRDDADSHLALEFTVVQLTNSSAIALNITENRYLSADAATGPANDNWTGTVEAVVACADRWGHKTESNRFTVAINNVNDPPVITSRPVRSAEPGLPYEYNVTAIDGDGDPVQFSLAKAPVDMTIESGTIRWVPGARGSYEVTVAGNDDSSAGLQSFEILVPNRPPRITSVPPQNCTAGTAYTYDMTAEDSNRDTLKFVLRTAPDGMGIRQDSGRISWTPAKGGSFPVSVMVSDGLADATQDFTILVNRVPAFTSAPVTSATVGIPYSYDVLAEDGDGDVLGFCLDSSPEGMTFDPILGRIAWTPASTGNYTVVLRASDGRGGETTQRFVITVSSIARCRVTIDPALESGAWQGRVLVTGNVTKGLREVVWVEVRIDSGEWTRASGVYSWRYLVDTEELGNGRHTLEARAFDGFEYSENMPIVHLNVQNPTGPDIPPAILAAILACVACMILGAAIMIEMRKKG